MVCLLLPRPSTLTSISRSYDKTLPTWRRKHYFVCHITSPQIYFFGQGRGKGGGVAQVSCPQIVDITPAAISATIVRFSQPFHGKTIIDSSWSKKITAVAKCLPCSYILQFSVRFVLLPCDHGLGCTINTFCSNDLILRPINQSINRSMYAVAVRSAQAYFGRFVAGLQVVCEERSSSIDYMIMILIAVVGQPHHRDTYKAATPRSSPAYKKASLVHSLSLQAARVTDNS